MTADDSLAGGSESLAALVDDDTEGCLCLVAGYAKQDGLIASVTAETEKRVMMSPALGDFLQLRYVDLGPQPGQVGDRSRPVRRIVADLMAVQETAGRSHFALIIIAKSATAIEGLIGSCSADPFLAGLRVRFVGIASSDDRKQENGVADITSSPAGSWQSQRELTDALRQRCEELSRYFAARGEPGLTRAEVAALRHAHAQPAAGGDGSEGDAGGAPAEAAVPDVLDDASETAGTTADQEMGTSQVTDTIATVSTPAGSAAGRRPAVRVSRWLPSVPWGRGQQAAVAGDPGAVTQAESVRKAMGLVYLLMVADQDAAEDPALGRLQTALLSVDRLLAAQQACGYQVRLVHGSDADLRGELQDAGRLGRRAAKRLVKTGDFTAVLKVVRGSLRRDCGLIETMATAAGLTVASPAVVIFTADPPMADIDAATVFGDLATEATVVWVVPRKLEGLVSPPFGTACGVAVLGDHQAVADEVLDVMHGDIFTSLAATKQPPAPPVGRLGYYQAPAESNSPPAGARMTPSALADDGNHLRYQPVERPAVIEDRRQHVSCSVRAWHAVQFPAQRSDGHEVGGQRVGDRVSRIGARGERAADHCQAPGGGFDELDLVPLVRRGQLEAGSLSPDGIVILRPADDRCPLATEWPLDVPLEPGGVAISHGPQDDVQVVGDRRLRVAEPRVGQGGPILGPGPQRPQFCPGRVPDTGPPEDALGERNQPRVIVQPHRELGGHAHPLLRAHLPRATHAVPVLDRVGHAGADPAFKVGDRAAVGQQRGDHGLQVIGEPVVALRREPDHAARAPAMTLAVLERPRVPFPDERHCHLECRGPQSSALSRDAGCLTEASVSGEIPQRRSGVIGCAVPNLGL